MTDFKSQIVHHRDTLNALHEHIKATFRLRQRSDTDSRAWQDACSALNNFKPDRDILLDEVCAESIAKDKRLRKFVFDFLSVDPVYFRSGYEKERLLKLLKSLVLTDHEKDVLRQAILRRIRTGALREFRRFCQLIPKIQTDIFLDELREAARSTDVAIKRRAFFALGYIVV